MPVNISINTNTVAVQENINHISVNDPNNPNIVDITQPITQIVEIITPGPQGPQGPPGPDTFPFTGSAIITGSLLIIGSTTSTEGFTGSLFGTASYALNAPDNFRIISGSVIASVNTLDNIFLITSGSSTFFTIDNQGSTTISSSASNIFLIKNQNNTPVLTVSQSGVIILSTQSVELTEIAPNGGIYFTSSSLFIGID